MNHEKIDMIFTARQVQEECKRQQLYLYQFFINLIKFLQKSPFGNSSDGFVYINVDGADLLSSRVIKSAVDINFENFKPFLVETGGKQGDIVVSMQFAMFLPSYLCRILAKRC